MFGTVSCIALIALRSDSEPTPEPAIHSEHANVACSEPCHALQYIALRSEDSEPIPEPAIHIAIQKRPI